MDQVKPSPSPEEVKPGRRIIPFPFEFLRKLFKTGAEIPHSRVIRGLPSDANFVGLQYAAGSDEWLLVFESSEWEPTPPGERLPYFNLLFEKVSAETIHSTYAL